MVGLLLVSHSAKLAHALKEMLFQMLPKKISIEVTGGTKDGRLGTDVDAIQEAIRMALGPDGVLVLVDIGGAVITVEMALERLEQEDRERVMIADAPLVEGAVIAATQASLGSNLIEVKRAAEEAQLLRKLG
jgi:PTS hybrid protein